jgi:hypothetical protein
MSGLPTFPGLDGLMTLSRREGVDIRPTLLRVVTDLYVQTERHTAEEERQFVELASRLIDQVDEPTRLQVRARLAGYARTPEQVAQQLALSGAEPPSAPPPAEPTLPRAPLQPRRSGNSEFDDAFFAATTDERQAMLERIMDAPLPVGMQPTPARASRALIVLEAAAFAADTDGFAAEISAALMLPAQVAWRAITDRGGEPLACICKAMEMPSDVFQRVLIFLDRERGASVHWVYRLSRLYDVLTINAARGMVTAWRGTSFSQARVKHQSMLHDDERHRPRAAAERPSARTPAEQPAMARRALAER